MAVGSTLALIHDRRLYCQARGCDMDMTVRLTVGDRQRDVVMLWSACGAQATGQRRSKAPSDRKTVRG